MYFYISGNATKVNTGQQTEVQMNIELRIGNAGVADALRRYVERRLHFALGRFGDRVGGVSVRLYGSGNTPNCKCRMSAELQPFGNVVVEERDPDLFTAIDRAAGRLGRRVARELDRIRDIKTGRESIRLAA